MDMVWHFAGIWEAVSDAVPDQPALVCGDVRRSWAEYDDRAARLATALADAGLGHDSKVGLYAHNSNEYLEAHYAAFKCGGVPVNVNYRYTEGELVYLLDNADAEAVVFDGQFADRMAAIRPQLPKLKLLVQIDDGSNTPLLDGALAYEPLIEDSAPLPRRAYSEDDIYMLYTGGTTGMPKGVMYRQGDFARALSAGYEAAGFARPQTREELVALIRQFAEAGAAPVSLAACPLMHGTGLWLGVIVAHNVGGCAVTMRSPHFDPDALWRLVETERINDIAIVGDAFAKPMLAALERAQEEGRAYDLSSLRRLISSGVMFSKEVKQGLLSFADVMILDSMGSTEGGMGSSVVSREMPPGDTASFTISPTTKVFDENDREIEPGSDKIGMIGNGGTVPVGYFKDPAKSAATFRTVNGVRYSFPGDFAKVAADGSLILLGRGSNCINTGGEKVYPEEVEEAVKAHPDVFDCLVVGVPDERFGERVTAVLSLRPGRALDEPDLMNFVRTKVAGYKAPRALIPVAEVRRAPNGKADYKWAKELARGG